MKKVVVLPQAYHKIFNAVTAANGRCEVGGVLVGHKLPGCYILVAATTPPNTQGQSLTEFVLNGAYHTKEAETLIRRFLFRPRVIGIWHSHICDGAVFSEQDKISNRRFSQLYDGAISVLVTMEKEGLVWGGYYVAPDGSSHLCRDLIIQDKRRRKMDGQDRCSNCVYWQHRTCVMTGQTKNDSICNCGQFKPRT